MQKILCFNKDKSDCANSSNKATLQTQFLVHKHNTTMFHEILNININKDPYEHFKVIEHKFKELNDLIEFKYPGNIYVFQF